MFLRLYDKGDKGREKRRFLPLMWPLLVSRWEDVSIKTPQNCPCNPPSTLEAHTLGQGQGPVTAGASLPFRTECELDLVGKLPVSWSGRTRSQGVCEHTRW